MRILNLYCGLGGNRKFWKGHNVTAVELNEQIAAIYQGMFPKDKVIVGNAHEYLLNNYDKYDFIWSSPPCQSHSKMMFTLKGRYDIRKYPEMELYQEIIYLKHFFKGNWVVENVNAYYKPLIEPTKVLGRHRFWSNQEIDDFTAPSLNNFIKAKAHEVKQWLDLDFDMAHFKTNSFRMDQALRNCVHPKLGLHVFNQTNKGKVRESLKGNNSLAMLQKKSKAIQIKQKQCDCIE